MKKTPASSGGLALWILAGCALALSLAAAFPAKAQDRRDLLLRQQWIHENAKDCCPHDRCFPVKAVPSIHFWNVDGFKSLVPLGKERAWPFVETFGCAYADAPKVIRCLFRPPPEAS